MYMIQFLEAKLSNFVRNVPRSFHFSQFDSSVGSCLIDVQPLSEQISKAVPHHGRVFYRSVLVCSGPASEADVIASIMNSSRQQQLERYSGISLGLQDVMIIR